MKKFWPHLHWSIILAGLCLLLMPACATTHVQQIKKAYKARLDLARSYLASGKARLALRELLPLQNKGRQDAQYAFLLGNTYLVLKKPKQAIPWYKRAIGLRPDFGEAWNNLGRTYYLEKETARAQKAFSRALAIPTYLTPEFPAYNLALIYREEGKPKISEHYLKLALEANWRYLPAYFLLTDLLLKQGQTIEAVRWLQKGVAAAPDNQSLMLKLAENLLRLGKKKEAIYWFKRIITLDSNSKPGQLAQDYLDILCP